MIVEYEAVDGTGKRVSDTLEAPDIRSAVETLRRRELFVTHASGKSDAKKKAKQKSTAPAGHKPVRLSGKQLTMLTRQMAMLLTSGSGVMPALQSIGRQFTKPSQIQMIRQLCNDLEEGSPLTDALRKFPRVFDSTYCAIIAAGEASGTLKDMFARLAMVVGKRRAVRNKVIGAMIYPMLLTSLSFVIINVLMFFVMPRFGEMFKTLGVELPASTSAMIATAEFTQSNSLLCGLAAMAGIAGLVTLLMSDTGRRVMVDVLTRLPLVRRLVHGLIQGETFRVLGMLIEARVGVLDAIELVRGVTRNPKFQALFADMEAEVTSGGSLSKALDSCGLIAPYICHAVRTGEESGHLGGAMSYVADILDEDNTELVATLTRLFEPIVLIVMGLVVGAVSISLFLPMFDVTSAVGK